MATYEEQSFRTYKLDDEGQRTMLANFTARIIEETRYIDGTNVDTQLKIEGKQASEDSTEESKLPVLTVPASSFSGLGWVMQGWGVRAVVQPGSSVKEDLRTAIQLASRPKVTTVYKKTGWQSVDGQNMYLHNGGAIGPAGNDPSITTMLPQELTRYNLATKANPKDAIKATLSLENLAPAEVMWPLIAGCFAPLFGPVDFGLHMTGRTGTFKSEVASLIQSHYGSELDARHLPASWSSTANALEALAYYAANAVLVVDDFVPTGTSWQIRNYHTTADKLIRAQGNQAGRSRLTDTSTLQTTMYPRGLILSTGEDTPEGHSVRARLLIMELSPGDVDAGNLTIAQRNRQFYPATTAALAQNIAKNKPDLKPRIDEIRADNLDVGHTRTPSMLANLIAVIEYFLNWAAEMKAITPKQANDKTAEATQAITDAAARQSYFLEAADPVDLLMATLRNVFAAGLGHLRTLQGGIPRNPTLVGWTEDAGPQNDVPLYKSHGPCIGWIHWDNGEIFLEANSGFNVLKKAAGSEMAVTKQTMFKRLKDSGALTRTDDARQRNTVRVTAENHPRQVLALAVQQALDQAEIPQDNGDAYEGDMPDNAVIDVEQPPPSKTAKPAKKKGK